MSSPPNQVDKKKKATKAQQKDEKSAPHREKPAASNTSNSNVYTIAAVVVVIGALLSLFISIQKETKPPIEITDAFARDFPEDNKTIWAPFSSNAVEVMAECCGWDILERPHKATLIWVRDEDEIDERKLKFDKGQILNLIEGTNTLTNKANLHKLLVKLNETSLQPETYVLGIPKHEDGWQEECVGFFKSAMTHTDYIWLTKEPDSAQGDGIYINPDIEKMKKEYLVDPKETDLNKLSCKPSTKKKSDEVVVQRYLLNPLLLNGKKMEIRTYWMIASLDPFIVLYHDGTVRLTTKDYKKDDWNNPLIHITNTAQQKKSDPNYWETVADRKWTVEQLAEYLQKNGKIPDANGWLANKLKPYLKKVIRTVAIGALDELKSNMHPRTKDLGRFELLGMDVILDDNLHPWLTEVQVGPGISRDPGVKSTIIPLMLEEMFAIALEVNVKKRFGLPVSAQTLKNPHRWELINVDK